MRFPKNSCAYCGHTSQCSKQTKMYVNYCGAGRDRVINQIRRAHTECTGRKGHTLTFRQDILAA